MLKEEHFPGKHKSHLCGVCTWPGTSWSRPWSCSAWWTPGREHTERGQSVRVRQRWSVLHCWVETGDGERWKLGCGSVPSLETEQRQQRDVEAPERGRGMGEEGCLRASPRRYHGRPIRTLPAAPIRPRSRALINSPSSSLSVTVFPPGNSVSFSSPNFYFNLFRHQRILFFLLHFA
jgi:hypothetical protein